MFGKLGGSHLFGDKKSQKNDSQTSTGLFGMPAPGATGASSGFGVLGDSSGPVASSSFSSASQSVFGSQGKPSTVTQLGGFGGGGIFFGLFLVRMHVPRVHMIFSSDFMLRTQKLKFWVILSIFEHFEAKILHFQKILAIF